MERILKQLGSHWLSRSLGAGVVSTAVDVAVLYLAVHGLRLPTVPASALGVVAGCLVSFVLNKYVAFGDAGGPVLAQAGKYAATAVAATLVHATLMGALVDHARMPLLAAKLLCDVVVFGGGCLFVYRFLIFRLGEASGR